MWCRLVSQRSRNGADKLMRVWESGRFVRDVMAIFAPTCPIPWARDTSHNKHATQPLMV